MLAASKPGASLNDLTDEDASTRSPGTPRSAASPSRSASPSSRMRSRFEDPAVRRRFYLDRGVRKRPLGAGSNMETLMQSEREKLDIVLESLFGDIPAAVCGGIAVRAYAPERKTQDIDVLVDHQRHAEAERRLAGSQWTTDGRLYFPNSMLGLSGSAWLKDGQKLDLIATDQPWGAEALAAPVFDQTGLRVLPLAYLVLMKIDSARGIDQGDLSRMLGRLDTAQVDDVVALVARHHRDPHAAEDVRQYAELGALEYWTPDEESG